MDERRHWWVALVLVGAASLLGATAAAGLHGFLRITYLLATPTFVALGVLVALRRLRPQTGIGIALVVGIAIFLNRLQALPDADAQDVAALGFFAFRGITLLSGAAFIALGPSRGLVVSALNWAGGVGIMLVSRMPLSQQSGIGYGVFGVAVTSAITILMFRLLSSSAVHARVQAEVAQESAELAFIDDLTGLPNRRQMTVHLRGAVARAVEGGGPDTLVMFDLDRFKAINDTMGHDVGDEVLRRTAGVATAALRDGDLLCRWGGEEFLILLSDADEDEGRDVAERCRRALEVVQGPTAVTASFGVTAIHGIDSITDALRRADLALYEAKAGGRNRIVARRPGYTPVDEGTGRGVVDGEASGLPSGNPPR